MKPVLANSIDQLFLAGTAVFAAAFVIALALPGLELGEEAAVDINEAGDDSPVSSPAPNPERMADADSSDD